MDKERRSRLKRVVGLARRVVEDDVKVQLRRLGIDENEIKPVEKLLHLSVEDRELRTKIVEAIEKEKAGDISYSEAFDRYVRHVGFTYVNRIAALRAMEVRNLIKETVIRKDVYGGHSKREYELAERERISDPYELLKAGLVEAFKEVSAEIRVLFDVNSEYSLVFLGHKALLELIRLLSEEVPEEDWKEDDIIGWIYQYYNEEARAEFKKAKRKPKADDIPVINQFYTPRWIVRVLVDNTLGRLWLEMNGRCPKLGEPIKRTREQLENPSGDTVDEFCSYLVPLSQEPPPREKKRVREIKVLDPACGSGHFLVYAFDVLFRMYREDEPDMSVEEIPRLILENNLFGIDIDLRAVQLAALSLYLKAKSYNPRLKITRMNLVCADARITDGKVRKMFLEKFAADPELQMIFAKIFEDLEYTYEIGSLLKVREPFERLLERRKQERGRQAILMPKIEGQTAISKSGKLEAQARLDVKVVEDKEVNQMIAVPKEITLEQMLNALKDFEKEAMEKRDMGTVLFASETEKSVGLLQLLSQKYDVVLMNPPYGNVPERTKSYLLTYFPQTHSNYYAAFLEQAIDLTTPLGFIGALTSRTYLHLGSLQWVRKNLLYDVATPLVILDLGVGVLEGAICEWSGVAICKTAGAYRNGTFFFRLIRAQGEDKKRSEFEKCLSALLKQEPCPFLYKAIINEFLLVPGMSFAYWASPSLRALFAKHPPLDKDIVKKPNSPKVADVKVGLQTSDIERFARRFWEVDANDIGIDKKWVPLMKEAGYTKFYSTVDSLVNWAKDGIEIEKSPGSYIRNKDFYFREGLTWTRKPGDRPYIATRVLPKGTIFTVSNQAVFPKREKWPILSLMTSQLAYFLLSLIASQHNWEIKTLASLPVAQALIASTRLSELSREAHDMLQKWDTGNEASTIFIKPWILQVLHGFNPEEKPITGHPFAEQFNWSDWDSLKNIRMIAGNSKMSLLELSTLAIKREEIMHKRLEELQKLIDEEVYRLYEISEEDRKLIERELALRRGESPSYEESEEAEEQINEEETLTESLSTETKVKDHVARLVSFYIKKTLESDIEGIVPIHKLVEEVRKKLAEDFGEDQVDAKEKEIKEILGKSLEEWIATEYFGFHVNVYKRRPIFLHLTSSSFSAARGSKGAINIFLHYHKLDRQIIPKILANHVQPELETTKWKAERLKRELQEARNQNNKAKEKELSKQLEAALSTLEELEGFRKALETVHNPRQDKTKLPKNPSWVQQKIAEVRDNGYNPVIDYGVRVNIEPLKEAGLLHKAAQRVK